jgi:hypothetical protein
MTREVVIQEGPLRVVSSFPQLEEMFTRSPEIVAFHARNVIGRWFGRHFREWKAQLPTGLRRMGARAYRYQVLPFAQAGNQQALREKIRRNPGELWRIQGRGTIRSAAALIHESGGVVRPTKGKSLAIPIGKFARLKKRERVQQIGGSPRTWNQRHPDRQYFVVRARRRGGRGVYLARKTGQRTAKGRERVEVVYALKREVRIPARLRLIATWQALAGYREQTLREATEAAAREMAGVAAGRNVG